MVLTLLILFLLGILIYQDFKTRSVSLIVMLALFGIFGWQAFLAEHSFAAISIPFLFNTAFVLLQLVLIALYFMVRQNGTLKFIDDVIGLGDIVFMGVCAMAFSTARFCVFYIISLIVALLGTIVVKNFRRNTKDPGVPLVGYMAISLMACVVVKLTTGMFDFYDDAFLLKFINS